jgi:hypothetical protein
LPDDAIGLLPVLLKGIDKGTFFVIDELDAKFHPALLRAVIELFTDPSINKRGAQLLFTSHDMTTMSNEVFRRDEIWFSAINGFNESVLYSLVDFKKENGDKPRKDENYNKQYCRSKKLLQEFYDRGITSPSAMVPATRMHELVEELEGDIHEK